MEVSMTMTATTTTMTATQANVSPRPFVLRFPDGIVYSKIPAGMTPDQALALVKKTFGGTYGQDLSLDTSKGQEVTIDGEVRLVYDVHAVEPVEKRKGAGVRTAGRRLSSRPPMGALELLPAPDPVTATACAAIADLPATPSPAALFLDDIQCAGGAAIEMGDDWSTLAEAAAAEEEASATIVVAIAGRPGGL